MRSAEIPDPVAFCYVTDFDIGEPGPDLCDMTKTVQPVGGVAGWRARRLDLSARTPGGLSAETRSGVVADGRVELGVVLSEKFLSEPGSRSRSRSSALSPSLVTVPSNTESPVGSQGTTP